MESPSFAAAVTARLSDSAGLSLATLPALVATLDRLAFAESLDYLSVLHSFFVSFNSIPISNASLTREILKRIHFSPSIFPFFTARFETAPYPQALHHLLLADPALAALLPQPAILPLLTHLLPIDPSLALTVLTHHSPAETETHTLLTSTTIPLTSFLPHLPYLHTYAPFFSSLTPESLISHFPALYASYCLLADLSLQSQSAFSSHLSSSLLTLPISDRWSLYSSITPFSSTALASFKRLCKKIPRLQGPDDEQQLKMAALFHLDPFVIAQYYVESVEAYPDALTTFRLGSTHLLPWECDLLLWIGFTHSSALVETLTTDEQQLSFFDSKHGDLAHFSAQQLSEKIALYSQKLTNIWSFLVAFLPEHNAALFTVLSKTLQQNPLGVWLFIPLTALFTNSNTNADLLSPLLSFKLLFFLLRALECLKCTASTLDIYDEAHTFVLRLVHTLRALSPLTFPDLSSTLSSLPPAYISTPTLCTAIRNSVDFNDTNRQSLLPHLPHPPLPPDLSEHEASILSDLWKTFWLLTDNDFGLPAFDSNLVWEIQCDADRSPNAQDNKLLASYFVPFRTILARSERTRVVHFAHLREIFRDSLPSPPALRYPAMLRRMRWAVVELFLRRVVFSEKDALACAKFLQLLASEDVHFVSVFLLIDELLTVLPARLPASSPKEAKRIGVFLREVLLLANRWGGEQVFYRECFGTWGFTALSKFSHAEYLIALRRWHATLNAQFVCLVESSGEQQTALLCLAECANAIALSARLDDNLEKLIFSTNNDVKKAATLCHDTRQKKLND